jgi:hypothetical protein
MGGAWPPQLRLSTLEGGGDPGTPRAVPLPGTLACVVAALLGWAVAARRRRRARAGSGQR